VRFRFGRFELDEDRFTLVRAGEPVAVQPKPFALLLHLARRHPAVVDHDELLEVVWADASVTRSSIARAVRSLRRSLGEMDDDDSIIRAVRGRGYGLAVDVEREGDAPLRPGPGTAAETRLFVGRDDLMQRLSRWLATAASGRGGVATVVGEPGIGKSRLLDAVAERAEAQGWLVLRGAASDDRGATALWPWVGVLRDAAAKLTTDEIEAALGRRGSSLLRVEPELLPPGRRHKAPRAALDDAEERFRLFDEAFAFLSALAARRPVLVELDDLQWADGTSLALLAHVAQRASGRALFVLGAHRPDADADRAAVLERIAAMPSAHPPLRLDGLAADPIASIAEAVSGRALTPAGKRALHERSGGNPFFAMELTRAGAVSGGSDEPEELAEPDEFEESRDASDRAGGGDVGGAGDRADARDAGEASAARAGSSGVPERIRASVRGRIAELSPTARSLLDAAAVLGDEIGLALLGEMLELGDDAVLDAAREVEAAWLLVEAEGAPGRLRFVHALVPEALYEGLTRKSRVDLHARAARAIEGVHGEHAAPYAAALAHHHGQSIAAGDTRKAVDYARRAGDAALERLAFAEAARHYRQALDWLEQGRGGQDAVRVQLFSRLATASYGGGDPEVGEQAAWRAFELADALGSVDGVVDAASRLTSTRYRGQSADRVEGALVRALEREEAGEGGGRPAQRSLLHGLRARTLSYTGDFADVDAASARALELARAARDPTIELRALAARDFVLASEPRYDERAVLSRDRIRLAVELDQPAEEFHARLYRTQRLIQEGDAPAIDVEIEELERLAQSMGHSNRARAFVLDLHALRALWQGHHAVASALLPEVEAAWAQVDPLYSLMSVGAKRFLVAALSGDYELIDANEVRRSSGSGQYALPKPYLCALAFRRLELGMLDEAREDFEFLSRHDYEDLQHDVTYLLTVVQLAQLAHDLYDAPRAAKLEAMMEPFAARYSSGHTTAVRGAVDRFRGLVRWTLGDLDGADALLQEAIALERRMRAAPWEALCRIDRARLLLARGGARDRAAAAEELRAAEEVCTRLDVPGITGRARPVWEQIEGG
jgi:DNA-binding winged helix-turn-helix (wHTH) protein